MESLKSKERLYGAPARPVVTYGCLTWSTIREYEKIVKPSYLGEKISREDLRVKKKHMILSLTDSYRNYPANEI